MQDSAPDDLVAYDIWQLSAVPKVSRKPSRVPLTPPLQFDYDQKILIDEHGNKSREMLLRLAEVLRAWFERDPNDRKKFKLELSYEKIAKLYEGGRIKKNAPDATAENINFRQSLRSSEKSKKHEDEPRYFATRFASDFRRFLKPYKISKKDLFDNDKTHRKYFRVPSGWHETRPMVGRAEVTKRPQFNRGAD
jgi:hypothetical protein